MNSFRLEAVKSLIDRPARRVEFPVDCQTNKPALLSSLFGCRTFGMKQLRQCLPKPVYSSFLSQVLGGKTMDQTVASAVAHAVRVWAQEHGATHYTHWFQPQTNATAEKHDCFLDLKHSENGCSLEVQPLDAFSGSQLIQAEPDASSFPHGGVRTTFEARGYTIWDPTSPMFLQDGPHGTSILYIPSIFISYNGDALDEKTVLLRSMESISAAAVRLLRALGDQETKSVTVTLGTEQEFFLVDRVLYSQRPDLKSCGRTLLGEVPAKHQQLEDHYFGNIPSRVLAAINEAELELWKLGVPLKTRHNEVAPSQFEVAPIFENANIAVDHNLLTMEVLHKVAHRHKLKVLYHEKPFKGVNGSGKHCNWSLQTDKGKNLLDPGANPENNPVFLLVLAAVLLGVHRHSGILRAAISSASNEHRLGANEAPPGIISAFLGEHLSEVLNSVEERRAMEPKAKPEFKSVKLGGTSLDVKVSTLPAISRDLTDRNRTSPFAFTGNKFEFRAVGSKQSPAFPVTVLNAAVASALHEVAAALEAKKSASGVSSGLRQEDLFEVIRHYITQTKAIRFEGNNYSQEWVQEAARRGLLNIKTAPEAFHQLLEPVNHKMLTETCHIFSPNELKSRYHVLLEKYAKDLLIESRVLRSIIHQHIFPAVFKYRRDLAAGIIALEQVKQATQPEKKSLEIMSSFLTAIEEPLRSLEATIERVEAIEEHEKQSCEASKLFVLMAEVRDLADKMERYLPDDAYPLPKYTELLFS